MVVNVFSFFFEIREKIVNFSIISSDIFFFRLALLLDCSEPLMFPCVEFGDFGQFEDIALRAAILDECQVYWGGGGRFRPL